MLFRRASPLRLSAFLPLLLACGGDGAPAAGGLTGSAGDSAEAGSGGSESGGRGGSAGTAGGGAGAASGGAAGASAAGGETSGASPDLFLGGKATLIDLDAEGLSSFDIDLQVQNQSMGDITLTHARLFFANPGGFAFDLGDPVADEGTFYGLGPTLKPATKPKTLAFDYSWTTPISHAVYFLEGSTASGAIVHGLTSLPVLRKGFTEPAAVPFAEPLTLTLQEPLETVQLASGERWLTVVGQIANLTPRAAAITSLALTLRGADGDAIVLDHDLLPRLIETAADLPLRPFFFTTPVPGGFTAGKITLEANGETAGAPLALSRTSSVTYRPGVLLHAPVLGAWEWGNGQGEDIYHAHLKYPEQRYAYDLLVRQGGKTSSGPATQNESYFAFGKPVFAAADGEVLLVVDDVADNLGSKASPANKPPRNSVIVLGHPEGRFTLYAHVQKDSALVKTGQMVKTGDQIAKVGNAGISTEPHLHFACFELDAAGHVRALPMRFDNLWAGASEGEVAAETPRGRAVYEAR